MLERQEYFCGCFIGIPLPDDCREKYDSLRKDLSDIAPGLAVINHGQPHITVCLAGKRSLSQLKLMAGAVSEWAQGKEGVNVRFCGVGYFTTYRGVDPKVLYLETQDPQRRISQLRGALFVNLPALHGCNSDFPYHPHLTLAKMITREERDRYQEVRREVEERVSQEVWLTRLDEVAIYALDQNTETPQYTKLLTVVI